LPTGQLHWTGGLEQIGGLPPSPSQDVDEKERRTLLRRKELQRSDEREANALAHEQACLGPLVGIRLPFEQRVGRRLDPEFCVRRRTEGCCKVRWARDQLRERTPATNFQAIGGRLGKIAEKR
jgi:hypothetical protein